MRAFQLKIVIKNSHPPIWRRIILQEGITFLQLANIFNVAMGWEGVHMFEFEITKEKTRICSNASNIGFFGGAYSYEEISTTCIDEYLERNNKLLYTYDLGDDWVHTVAVEKIIENYEYNYPQVIKYKGDCPTEDCGGIYGYYHKMQILNDPEDPEYGELMEWCGGELSEKYDVEKVNEILKNSYNLDNIGFIDKEYAQFQNETYGNFYEEQRFKYKKLEDVYVDFSKDQLAEIIQNKKLGIEVHKNKNTLISAITKYMLDPETMRAYFVCLLDEEIRKFDILCKKEGLQILFDIDNIEELLNWGYVASATDGRFSVPIDVKEIYNSFKGKNFDEDRKKVSYVMLCLKTAALLYEVTPMSILIKLIKQNSEIDIDVNEIHLIIEKLPPEINEYFIKDDTLYVESLYNNSKNILEIQGQNDYYIPTLEEIYIYGKYGYDEDLEESINLYNLLLNDFELEEDEAEILTRIIQIQLSAGESIEKIVKQIVESGVMIPNETVGKLLISSLIDLSLNVRKVDNRGHKDIELHKTDELLKSLYQEYEEKTINDKSNANDNNVIDFEKAKKGKIYPNDPCPCGSGKKYKNCCRNRR